MTSTPSAPVQDTSPGPRLWPLWWIAALQLLALVLTVTPSIQNALRFYFMMLGPAVCLLLFLIWLAFASRLPIKERLLIFLAFPVAFGLAVAVLHSSMGLALWLYGLPLALLALPFVLRSTRSASTPKRLITVAATLLLCFLALAFSRLQGFNGDYHPEFAWRWSTSAEDALASETLLGTPREVMLRGQAEWPGFRGPLRDGRVLDFGTALDWQSTPPEELWRIPVGPAWSSFAYASGRLFTQEQRGEEEVVSCYDATTGEPIWRWAHTSRFTDAVAGPGPRATPEVVGDRVFTLGARALLAAHDAETGRLLWQRDLMDEVDAMLPVWGFSGSPLVVDDAVVIYAGGSEGRGLLAYSADSGEPLWHLPSRGMNFVSAQSMRLDGEDLVLFTDGKGLMALDPVDGTVLWQILPSGWTGPPMVQLQQLSPDSLAVALGDGAGIARIQARVVDGEWKAEEIWSSQGLKPSYNDFVVHDGHLYGFDPQHLRLPSPVFETPAKTVGTASTTSAEATSPVYAITCLLKRQPCRFRQLFQTERIRNPRFKHSCAKWRPTETVCVLNQPPRRRPPWLKAFHSLLGKFKSVSEKPLAPELSSAYWAGSWRVKAAPILMHTGMA